MHIEGQQDERDHEEAMEQPSSLRHPVLALASALGCREGQAYSVVVGGLLAVLLAALGLPPVFSHRSRAAATPPPIAPVTAAPGGAAAAPPVVPDVTSAAAPALELPALSLPPGVPVSDGAAVPPSAADPAGTAPAMTGTGETLRGREGTPLLAPIPVSGAVAVVSNAGGRQLTAIIDWGDGGPPSKGDVSATSEQTFQVTASHAYVRDGSYKITVTITDTTGASLVVVSRAEIAEPPDALNKAIDDVVDAAP
jgi:hypothetical protein